jgi:DNA-binding CsgD family transcriptional regulator
MHIVIEDSLSALMRAETYGQIGEVITDFANQCGFEYFGYQYWPGDYAYGHPEFSGTVQTNFPQVWQRRYVEKNYYHDDPVRLFGLEQEGMLEWSQVPRWNARQETMMQDAANYGLEEGIVASCHENPKGRLQLTLAGKSFKGDMRLAAQAMPSIVPVMLVCFRCAHKLEDKIKWLTERQRDVFLLLRKGQRRENIASQLSLSVRQVDRHIARIKENTGTNLVVGD